MCESMCSGLSRSLILASGLFFDPVVDVLACAAAGAWRKSTGIKPAVVVAFDQLLKVREDALAGLRPEGIGREQLERAAACSGPAGESFRLVQLGDQAMERGVKLAGRQREMQGLGDLQRPSRRGRRRRSWRARMRSRTARRIGCRRLWRPGRRGRGRTRCCRARARRPLRRSMR